MTEQDLAHDLPTKLCQVEASPFALETIPAWGVAALCRAVAAEAEVARLQGIISGLADRVAAQSELLSKRAEAGGSQ